MPKTLKIAISVSLCDIPHKNKLRKIRTHRFKDSSRDNEVSNDLGSEINRWMICQDHG